MKDLLETMYNKLNYKYFILKNYLSQFFDPLT